jgi:hypothetical protein
VKCGCIKAAQFCPTLAMTMEVKTIVILKSARNLQRSKEAHCGTECGLFVLL